jgi:hypothetical protein
MRRGFKGLAQLPDSVFLRFGDGLHLVTLLRRNLGDIYSHDCRQSGAAGSRGGLKPAAACH